MSAPVETAKPVGDQAVPPSVRNAAAWSWRLLLIGAALAVLLWLLSELKVVVVPIAVALLLTVLLAPFVGWIQRRTRLPRVAAVGIALVGLIVAGGRPAHARGTVDRQGLRRAVGPGRAGHRQADHVAGRGPAAADDRRHLAAGWTGSRGRSAAAAPSWSPGRCTRRRPSAHVAAGALIALFCTFFFLLDGRTIWAWVVGLLPRGSREHVHQAGRRGLVTLGAYTRTQILVAAVDAVGIGLGAAILQVPLALPLAVLVFLGSFIPIVGAVVTGSVAILVALVVERAGVGHLDARRRGARAAARGPRAAAVPHGPRRLAAPGRGPAVGGGRARSSPGSSARCSRCRSPRP